MNFTKHSKWHVSPLWMQNELHDTLMTLPALLVLRCYIDFPKTQFWPSNAVVFLLSTQCLAGAALHLTDGLRPLVVGDPVIGTIGIGPGPHAMMVVIGKKAARAVLHQKARPGQCTQMTLVHNTRGERTKVLEVLRLWNLPQPRHRAVLGFLLTFDAE